MFKKILQIVSYITIIAYILTAPHYLNNEFSEKYLRNKDDVKWSGVITMWDIPRLTVNGSEFGWIKGRIDAYEQLNPNIHIDLRQLHYDDNKTIAFNAALSEDHPDIMPLFIDNEVLPLDHVMPVNVLDEDDQLISIKDALISSVYKDGKLWGVPVYYSVNVLIVNKSLTDSLGVTIPQEPNSDNFMDFLMEIEEKQSSMKTTDEENIAPFDFYIDDYGNSAMPFFFSDGADIFSTDEGGKVNFYSEKVATGIEKLKRIDQNLSTLHKNYGSRDKAEATTDFYNGKTAVLAGSTTDINGLIRKINQGSGFDYEIMAYPKEASDVPTHFVEDVGAYAVMKTNNKDKEEAIYDFMTFLLSEESQQSIETIGRLPAVEGYHYDFKTHSYLNDLYDTTLLRVMPFYLDRSQIYGSINGELQKMLQNNQPVTETLYNIQQNVKTFP